MRQRQENPTSELPVRLVTFLGTGEYKETTYTWQREQAPRTCRTRFVARALAEIATVSEVVVLSTKEAWTKHGEDFQKQLSGFGLKTPIELLCRKPESVRLRWSSNGGCSLSPNLPYTSPAGRWRSASAV